MKKVVSMFAILVMVAALCVGCQKDGTSTGEDGQGSAKKAPAENWQPPAADDKAKDDHSGHNHGPGGHKH